MKVVLTLPPPMEAVSEVDTKKSTVAIEPRFFKGLNNATVGRVVVENSKGVKREFILQVSGGSGNLMAQETHKTVTPRFDELTSDEFKRMRAAQIMNRRKKKTPPEESAPAGDKVAGSG